ncbi:hypothetical protein [Psychroflexus tropicus]|uniref:hypothetical protein n=1 Tax=Psychroflexus tropicus TaxID=197345 RepID=UPI0012FB0A85|nr:hypothetical protein [Psychroflexus tropicus]
MNRLKNIASIYTVLGFGLLLLFSPCKVRNFIQAELGVEQTQVSSKSQSYVPYFNCQTQDIAQAKALTSKLDFDQKPSAATLTFTDDIERSSFQSPDQNAYRSPPLASSVPFYILYSQLKVYL